MNIKKIPRKLYEDIQEALKNAKYYDKLEQYVLIQVLCAAKRNQPIEQVFIKCARTIFKRHPLDSADVAA